MHRPRWIVALVLLVPGAGRALEVVPRVGVDFEHFGESYRVTEDQDTLTTINDFGTLLGLTVATPAWSSDRFRLDSSVHLGQETRRLRLDVEGRLERGKNVFELQQAGSFRLFVADGDYSISRDALDETLVAGWERRLSPRVRLRFRETLDLTWHADPDQYNLNTLLHRPGVDLRVGAGQGGEVRMGYRLGRRSVPDSASLAYWRHTGTVGLSLLPGSSAALEVSSELDRRQYEPGSVRESSWEQRGNLMFEVAPGERVTLRVLHENEVVRFDQPDELDFDRDWLRTGVQVEGHTSPRLDLSLMPVVTWLTSATAPQEEYTETGLEVGVDWRIGTSTWISLSDEIGRRDYEVDATEAAPVTDLASAALLLSGTDSAFSDFGYNRLTLLVSSDVFRTVSIHLFANWQPESHNLTRHDAETRIVSGGVEYRF